MDKDKLVQIFNEQTSGKNHVKGMRVLNNDLVSSVDIQNRDGLLCINGKVISESLFNEYNVKIEIDIKSREVISTYCTCMDYENNEFRKTNYCCKHILATFYKSLDDVIKSDAFKDEGFEGSLDSIYGRDTLSMLLGDESEKKEIKIEVYVIKNQWDNRISAQFKIGLNSMRSNELYVLKDINQFLLALTGKIAITYGKRFTLNMKYNKLNVKDKRLVDFIQTLRSIEGNYTYRSKIRKSNIEGKYIHIPDYLVREFFYTIKYHRVYLDEGFLYRTVETEVIQDNPPLQFQMEMVKNNYELQVTEGMPISLSSRDNVFFYGTTIYLPSSEYCEYIKPYLKVFAKSKKVLLPADKETTILRELVPKLNLLSYNVKLSKEIKCKVVDEKCEIRFYFDKPGKSVVLTTKVKYGKFEFNIFEDCNEKIIYRDSKKETEVLTLLRSLGFERRENEFLFIWGDDYIFRFFKSEISKLQQVGEVFYSENFKGIKSLNSKNISANIRSGKYDYFEIEFKLGDIPKEEIAEILRAFRDNLKYYKLKDGQYIDLEEIELRKFLKLIDSISEDNIDNNSIQVHKNKSIYIDEYIAENKIRYIKGKSELKKIRDKIKNIKNLKFKEPENLKGNLRQYQKFGYNWFKTLDYLGFGGILGDEMGLGKTLQSIAFLLSNKDSKSLIVVPTSLVYNWINEFEKFAPDMKVKAILGNKNVREELIENIYEWDVSITTYNLLKRDIDMYESKKFDYCLIDEAQYIKNPHSQNALAVKNIKARRRFALTGTPVENSVMELWSIFDFIMPGYLYDEKRFNVRYYKRFKEEPEVIEDLNRLTKPFILRRRKKDVIKELPDKIERTILVEMGDKQKKVYKSYANYALDMIKHKVEDYEFKNSKIEILSYITKLRQLCLDPSIVMKDYTGSSAKIEGLLEFLDQVVAEGHKILIFSQFTSVLKNIGKEISLKKIKYMYLDGSVNSKDRMTMVDEFNSGIAQVFLISLKAGGTGLNLTSADIVVHFDPWWNPAVEAQATDRAHRIGQKNVVEVVKLIARGTIEEKILKLQEEKKRLIDNLIGDEMSGSHGITSLSDQEIINLFR
jgi:SNF2 family DNA or RNA helicase/predicted nucleic acid-binding Zn finger protein